MRDKSVWPRAAIVAPITFAATAGALVAVGRRLGDALVPFAWIGETVARHASNTSSAGLVVTGLILHAGATVVWSAIFVWLTREWRWGPALAAAVIGAADLFVSWLYVLSTGTGVAGLLALGDRIVLAVVLAGALAAGARIAESKLRT